MLWVIAEIAFIDLKDCIIMVESKLFKTLAKNNLTSKIEF
jgi:hypothetical protein